MTSEDSPAGRVHQAIIDSSEAEVVELAIALLAGYNVGEEFLLVAGGPHAQGLIDGAPPLYWPEVWGARVLLHAWNDTAAPAVLAGLQNQAWRVREMCCRVTAARKLDGATYLRELLTDDTARVRTAAARALGEVGTAADLEILATLFSDPEIDVRRAAQQGRTAIEKR